MDTPEQHHHADYELVPREQTASPDPIRTEEILLERLKNQPAIRTQIGANMLGGIILLVLAAGFIIYLVAHKEDKFADNPHAKQQQEQAQQEAADSAKLASKRATLAPLTDSLKAYLVLHGDDIDAHLHYADALYEGNYWDEAQKEFEIYLAKRPKDADAIVDYAFVMTQTTHDFKGAIDEIEKALKIDPDHVKGLFNAGLLSVQAYDDKNEAISKAESYFKRALAAAEKKGDNEMIPNIKQVLDEIEKIKSEKGQGTQNPEEESQ